MANKAGMSSTVGDRYEMRDNTESSPEDVVALVLATTRPNVFRLRLLLLHDRTGRCDAIKDRDGCRSSERHTAS